MYTDISTILEVRRLYDEGIKKITISKRLKISRPTIDKILNLEDFGSLSQEDSSMEAEKCETDSESPSILDPYKDIIKSWLEADKTESHKQRHTNKHIFDRLVDECGYTGGHTTVYNYVGQLREELSVHKKKNAAEGYLPLYHYPGEAQADFGKARFEEDGKSHNGSYLTLSFPFSNYGLLQITYGENLECVLESLKAIFEYLGKVPNEIWFDNASSIVKIVLKSKDRNVSERFELFASHYKFNFKFMNPGKGHEKGHVENKVGALRNALLVPVPKFKNLEEENFKLLEKCNNRSHGAHYKKGVPVSELFKEDLEVMHPLPSMPFDTCRRFTVHTNKCGIFTLANGYHSYSSAPNYCEKDLRVVLSSREVSVYGPKGELIVTHPRMYGSDKEHMERIDYIPYLKFIARKPHSFHNMPIKELMPPRLCSYIEGLSNPERGIVLTELWEVTQEKGLEEAIDVLAMRYTPEPVLDVMGQEAVQSDEEDSLDFSLDAYDDIF